MNNVFIDVVPKTSNKKTKMIEGLFLRKFGFYLKEDKVLKSKTLSTYFLLIDNEIFLKNKNSSKVLRNIFYMKGIKGKVNLVYSKSLHDNKEITYLISNVILNLNDESKLIEKENELKKQDMFYILKYITENNISKEKFKILIVINNINDLDENKIREYILNYKYVDVLKTDNISKNEYKKLSSIVEKINEEYGSSIQILQKRNIQNYDFYVIFSKNIKEKFLSHFQLGKKSYVLDITDVDDDINSKEYKSYVKNKAYISTLFDRLNIDLENFKKSELGLLYLKN